MGPNTTVTRDIGGPKKESLSEMKELRMRFAWDIGDWNIMGKKVENIKEKEKKDL